MSSKITIVDPPPSPLGGQLSVSPGKRTSSDDGEHSAKRPAQRTILGVSPCTELGRHDGGIFLAVDAPLAQRCPPHALGRALAGSAK